MKPRILIHFIQKVFCSLIGFTPLSSVKYDYEKMILP